MTKDLYKGTSIELVNEQGIIKSVFEENFEPQKRVTLVDLTNTESINEQIYSLKSPEGRQIDEDSSNKNSSSSFLKAYVFQQEEKKINIVNKDNLIKLVEQEYLQENKNNIVTKVLLKKDSNVFTETLNDVLYPASEEFFQIAFRPYNVCDAKNKNLNLSQGVYAVDEGPNDFLVLNGENTTYMRVFGCSFKESLPIFKKDTKTRKKQNIDLDKMNNLRENGYV